jgi:hypothetical protein
LEYTDPDESYLGSEVDEWNDFDWLLVIVDVTSCIISDTQQIGRTCSCISGSDKYKIVVRKPTSRILLGGDRCGRRDNIKM